VCKGRPYNTSEWLREKLLYIEKERKLELGNKYGRTLGIVGTISQVGGLG